MRCLKYYSHSFEYKSMSIKMSWYMFRVNSSMKPPSKPEITTAFYMCTDRERFYWSHDIWCCFRYNWHNSYIFCYLTKYAITLTRSIYYLFQDAALSKLFGISKVIGSQITYFWYDFNKSERNNCCTFKTIPVCLKAFKTVYV